VNWQVKQTEGGSPVKEKEIRGPNLNKSEGEQPFTWNNWSRKSAPIESDCLNGVEYTFTLSVTIGPPMGSAEKSTLIP
jgi:hypothetical protein